MRVILDCEEKNMDIRAMRWMLSNPEHDSCGFSNRNDGVVFWAYRTATGTISVRQNRS
jgi:hypothetical protein